MNDKEKQQNLARQARTSLLSSFISFDLVLLFFAPNWLANLYCLGGLGALFALFTAVRGLTMLRVYEIKSGPERTQIIVGLIFAMAAFLLAFYLMLTMLDAGQGFTT